MKKSFILLFVIAICLCVLKSDIIDAWTYGYSINVPNEKITYSNEYDLSEKMIHAVVLYGSPSSSSTQHIQLTLQRKIGDTWFNQRFTIYLSNGLFTDRFGSFDAGKYRIRFDTLTAPYYGTYYGNIEHFAV